MKLSDPSPFATLCGLLGGCLLSSQVLAAKPLIHDAEHYILEAQNGEQ